MHTLEAALWAFHASSTFKEGPLLAVNLGEDADTTGAVYGQLAGAFYDVSAIPSNSRDRLYEGQRHQRSVNQAAGPGNGIGSKFWQPLALSA